MRIIGAVLALAVGVAVAANAQTKTAQMKVLGQGVTWRVSCDEVLGAALTMPGAQQVEGPYDPLRYAITVPFDGQDTLPGQDTLVELWRGKPNAKELKDYAAKGVSVTKDQDLCRMWFPMLYPFPFHQMDKKETKAWLDKQPLTEKVMREERAWVCEVVKLLPDAKCPDEWKNPSAPKRVVDPEFQKTSMMEIKRIAAEAGY